MRGPITAGVVLLVLAGLSLVRVGGAAEYAASGFSLFLRLGPLRLRVYPPRAGGGEKKKEKKPRRAKKKKPAAPEHPAPEKGGGTLELLRLALPAVARAAGRLRRKIRIDRLYLDYTVPGANDPAAAALAFGGGNAAAGMILPLLENNFNLKDRRIRSGVDFQAEKPAAYLWLSLSMTLGQAAAFSVRLLADGVKIYRAYRAQGADKQKEAV